MEEASNLAQQTNDSLFTYIILRSVANDFYSKNDYILAYEYYAKATEYNDFYPSTFYMAALTYSRIENNDSIDYWIQKAIDLAKIERTHQRSPDNNLRRIHFFDGNPLQIYYIQKNQNNLIYSERIDIFAAK